MTKVQRYKVGYYTDEWGMSIISPCLIPNDSGFAVKFEDYCKLETELAAIKADNAVQPEASTTLEQAASHAHICDKLAEDHKDDALLFAALTDAAAIIRDLLRELRRETERRWEGNRLAAQEYVEDVRDVLQEAAQICKDLDDEALAKESRLACGAECAAAIAYLAAQMNLPFEKT